MKKFKVELNKLVQIKTKYNLEVYSSKLYDKSTMIGVIEGQAISININYSTKTIVYKSIKHGIVTHYCY